MMKVTSHGLVPGTAVTKAEQKLKGQERGHRKNRELAGGAVRSRDSGGRSWLEHQVSAEETWV